MEGNENRKICFWNLLTFKKHDGKGLCNVWNMNYLIKNFEHFESDCQGCLESNFDESITVSESQCWVSLKKKHIFFSNSNNMGFTDAFSQSQIWHYFISYLLTCEVNFFEILELMAQMWHYITFLAINQQRWLQTLFWNIWKKL